MIFIFFFLSVVNGVLKQYPLQERHPSPQSPIHSSSLVSFRYDLPASSKRRNCLISIYKLLSALESISKNYDLAKKSNQVIQDQIQSWMTRLDSENVKFRQAPHRYEGDVVTLDLEKYLKALPKHFKSLGRGRYTPLRDKFYIFEYYFYKKLELETDSALADEASNQFNNIIKWRIISELDLQAFCTKAKNFDQVETRFDQIKDTYKYFKAKLEQNISNARQYDELSKKEFMTKNVFGVSSVGRKYHELLESDLNLAQNYNLDKSKVMHILYGDPLLSRLVSSVIGCTGVFCRS